MSAVRVFDLCGVEVEHLVSDRTTAGRVKLRAISEDVIVLGQMDPEAAREIAAHLFEAAARAEYEADFITECGHNEAPAELVGYVIGMVRAGEVRRRTDTPD